MAAEKHLTEEYMSGNNAFIPQFNCRSALSGAQRTKVGTKAGARNCRKQKRLLACDVRNRYYQ